MNAYAECKAFSSPVAAKELTAFYGKLNTSRLESDDVDGFFFALPRVTQPGAEQARLIESKDTGFKYLNADKIADIVRQLGLVTDVSDQAVGEFVSDRAIIITHHGIYSGCKSLNPDTRTTAEIIVWGIGAAVPVPVIELIAASDYAEGIRVRDISAADSRVAISRPEVDQPVIVEVRGSQSDFEYQLPTSPRYFVGRRRMLAELLEQLNVAPGVIVINAQSGWGKSSLALRLKQSVHQERGVRLHLR